MRCTGADTPPTGNSLPLESDTVIVTGLALESYWAFTVYVPRDHSSSRSRVEVGMDDRASAHQAGSVTGNGRIGSTKPSPPLPAPGALNAIMSVPFGDVSEKLVGSKRNRFSDCAARRASGLL